jgi:hypothetical protein
MSKDEDAPPTYEEAVQPTPDSHTSTAPLPSYSTSEGYQPVPHTVLPPAGTSVGYTIPPQQYPINQYPAQPYPTQHVPAHNSGFNKYNTRPNGISPQIVTPQLINRGTNLDPSYDTIHYRNVGT